MVLFGSHWKEGDLVLKKATEYGAVEIWMNERVRRACANSCADFVYGFLEVRILGYHCLTCLEISKAFSVSSFIIIVCLGQKLIFSFTIYRGLQRRHLNIGLYGGLKGMLP